MMLVGLMCPFSCINTISQSTFAKDSKFSLTVLGHAPQGNVYYTLRSINNLLFVCCISKQGVLQQHF